MTLEELIELAKEVESEDPIDFGTLNISEDDVYNLVGSSVLEQYQNWKSQDANSVEVIMLSTILKLVVENFVLNLKLHQGNSNGSKIL